MLEAIQMFLKSGPLRAKRGISWSSGSVQVPVLLVSTAETVVTMKQATVKMILENCMIMKF